MLLPPSLHLQVVPTSPVQHQRFAAAGAHYRGRMVAAATVQQIVRAQHQRFDLVLVVRVVVVARHPQHRVRVAETAVHHVGRLVELVQLVHS